MPAKADSKAVFLDRDGTIIEDMEYWIDLRKLRAARGAVDGLRKLQEAGYLLIVTTNQSGVARGFFQETELVTFSERMVAMFAEQGVRIDGVYYCPHHAEGVVPGYSIRCDCRKPAPGMLLRAAREFGVDLAQSWMIGDSPDDVRAGRAAGCRAVLLAAGDIAGDESLRPDFVAEDMRAASELILREA